jgi:hypothetical protein
MQVSVVAVLWTFPRYISDQNTGTSTDNSSWSLNVKSMATGFLELHVSVNFENEEILERPRKV